MEHIEINKSINKQLYFNNALNKIADVIITSNQADEILENSNRIISETLDVDRSVIFEISYEQKTLTGLIEWISPNHPEIARTSGVYPFDSFHTLIGIIRKTENFIQSHSNNVNENFNPYLTKLLHYKLDIKSLLWYPFAFDENGFHVFALNQIKELREWTIEDIGFIESAAKQVSLALIKIQLRESESKYRLLFECSNEAIIIVKEGKVCLSNPSASNLTGYTEKEIKSIPFQYFIHPDDRAQVHDNHLKRLRGDDFPSRYIFRLLNKDGSTRWVFMNAVLITWEDVPATLNFFTDITELKHTEEALEESSKKWEAIISASPDGIGMITLDGKIQIISEKLVKMHGYPVELMNSYLGRSIYDYIDPIDHEKLIKNTRKLLSGEKETAITEYRALRKDGSQFYIDINASILYDSKGTPTSILYVERDISERKMVENEIKNSNQELKRLIAEKDKLFSIVAHDLRSPFFSLLGFTEILASDSQEMSSAEIKKFSLSLNESVGNLYKLLENLLEWAQLQKGMVSFNPRILSLFQVYIQSINPIKQRAAQKEITIVNEISGNQEIYADESMVSSILRNLLSNAVKFSHKGGKITVKAAELENGMVEISISDNGVGIPESLIDKIFRLGEKVNSRGTDNEPSTGLGLILCKEFVEKHKGNIRVESEEGKGSTFYFSMPVKSYSN